jgi:hypothetical protein
VLTVSFVQLVITRAQNSVYPIAVEESHETGSNVAQVGSNAIVKPLDGARLAAGAGGTSERTSHLLIMSWSALILHALGNGETHEDCGQYIGHNGKDKGDTHIHGK